MPEPAIVLSSPKIDVKTTITIELPLGTADTLNEMFSFGNIGDTFAKHVSGGQIGKLNIDRAVADVHAALAPALYKVRQFDLARQAIIEGRYRVVSPGGEIHIIPTKETE